MNHYRATIELEVYFDSETEPDVMTEEEVDVRSVDAVTSNDVLDSRVIDWYLDKPGTTVREVPA